MNKSDTITALAPALIKAQATLSAAQKSKKNKLLTNSYATLDDVIRVVRPALAEHGLSFIQPLTQNENGMTMETIILHESGEWISSTVNVREGPTNKGVNFLQAMGSGISYMRRYALSSMLGVATEDDDGNGPAKRKTQPRAPQQKRQVAKPPTAKPPEGYQNGSEGYLQAGAFNPKQPDLPCNDWQGMFLAGVQTLGFNAVQHVKNALKKEMGEGAKGTIPECWAALVKHRADKKAGPDVGDGDNMGVGT